MCDDDSHFASLKGGKGENVCFTLFFYIAVRPCAKCEDTSLRWRINAPVASLNAPPPSRFSNESLASARMRHTSDIPNVWTKVILQKRSGTLLIFQTCRRKAGLRTANL